MYMVWSEKINNEYYYYGLLIIQDAVALTTP